eukprot:m.91951 g.91951  ORF g.91951 m.91951 type:complete len:417 (+) comp12343_c0_seq3:94-1344(+)
MERKEPGKFVKAYTHAVDKYKIAILVVWGLLFVAGIVIGPRFLGSTTLTVSPPTDSDAYYAQELLRTEFPQQAHSSPIICLLKQLNGQPILGDAVKNFTLGLQSSVSAYGQDIVPKTGFLSYYTLVTVSKSLAETLVCQEKACNSSETIILLDVDAGSNDLINSKTQNFTSYITRHVKSLTAEYLTDRDISARLTGTLVFGGEIAKGTERDLLLMDGIAFPIALATLAYVLRSGRLLILPVLSMLTSILTSFMIMYPVAKNHDVISFTPSLMMSGTIAMSIDYSLFLLSRYREELQRGRTVYRAVMFMLWTAGHTISVSGTTISLCFFGLMFFPVSILRSPGLGAGIAIMIVLICNLTLTPAMLLLFNNFFRKCVKKRYCGNGKTDDSVATDEENESLLSNAPLTVCGHDVRTRTQ